MTRYEIMINTIPWHVWAYSSETAILKALTVFEILCGPNRGPVRSVEVKSVEVQQTPAEAA